jgi:hypothetical protein
VVGVRAAALNEQALNQKPRSKKMSVHREPISDEAAMAAAVNWGKQRFDTTEIKASVAEREGAEVLVDLEMPEEARAVIVHVCLDAEGKTYIRETFAGH